MEEINDFLEIVKYECSLRKSNKIQYLYNAYTNISLMEYMQIEDIVHNRVITDLKLPFTLAEYRQRLYAYKDNPIIKENVYYARQNNNTFY